MKRILFIGNSFTYYNDMPGLLAGMIRNGGDDSSVVESVTKSRFLLSQFLDPEKPESALVNAALQPGKWDFVVLQEQSSDPALDFPAFAASADRFVERIRDIGAEPLFYQTWAYRDGTEKLKKTGLSYFEFYDGLRRAYRKEAEKHRAVCVPAGDVFYRLSLDHPSLALMRDDNYHPTLLGSYAIAALFYLTLFGTDREVAFRPDEITSEDAAILIAAARAALS